MFSWKARKFVESLVGSRFPASAVVCVVLCASTAGAQDKKPPGAVDKTVDFLFQDGGSLFGRGQSGVTADSRYPMGYGWNGRTEDSNSRNCAEAKAKFAAPPCSNRCSPIPAGGFNVGNVMGTIGGFLGGGTGSLMSTIMNSVGSRGNLPANCQAYCQFLQLNCDGRLADAYKKLYERCEKAIDDRKREEESYLKSCSKLGVANCVDSINQCQGFLSARTAAEARGATNPGNMNKLYAQACPHLACADMNEQKEMSAEFATELKEAQQRLQEAQNETVQAFIRDDEAFSAMRMGFLENERDIVTRGNQLGREIRESTKGHQDEILAIENDLASREFKMKDLMGPQYLKVLNDYDEAMVAVDNECREKAGLQLGKEKAAIEERTKTGEGVSHLSLMRAQMFNLNSEVGDDQQGARARLRERCMRGRGAWFKLQKAEREKTARLQQIQMELEMAQADQQRKLKQLEQLHANFNDLQNEMKKIANDDVKYKQAQRVEMQNRLAMKNQIVLMENQGRQQKTAAIQMQLEQIQYAQRLQCTQWPMLAACSAGGANTSGALAKVQGLGNVRCPPKDSNKDYSEVVSDLQKLLRMQSETAGRCCTIANDGKLDPTVEPFVYEAQQACVVGRQSTGGGFNPNGGTQGVR